MFPYAFVVLMFCRKPQKTLDEVSIANADF